jgi:hypothetical protein
MAPDITHAGGTRRVSWVAHVGAAFLLVLPVLARASSNTQVTKELLPTVANIFEYYIPLFCIVVAAYFIAFLRPQYGFVIYMALLPFRSLQVITFGAADVTLPDVVAPPLVAGWILNNTFRPELPRSPFRRTGVDKPLLLFAGWVVLSLFWSVGYGNTISKIIQMVYAICLFYMGVQMVKNPRYSTLICSAWVLGASVNSFFALQGYLATHDRSGGLNTNALEAGMYALFGISLTIGTWMGVKNPWGRTVLILALLVQLFGFILTQARGPLIGLTAGLVLPFFLNKELRRLMIRGAFCVVVLYTVLYLLSLDFTHIKIPNPLARLMSTGNEGGSGFDVGEVYRYDVWYSIIFHLIPASPFLGIGAGSLRSVLMNWGHVILFPEREAHSMYLEVLVGLGPIGFGLMLWFWAGYWLLLWRYYPKIQDRLCKAIVLSGMCVVISKCVAGLTYGYFIEDRYQWTTLGVILAFAKVGMEMQGIRTPMSDPEPLELAPEVLAVGEDVRPVQPAARPRLLPA